MTWDLNANGHICIYGGTSTGKTVFMKDMIDKYIIAGKYTADEIFIFLSTLNLLFVVPYYRTKNTAKNIQLGISLTIL